MDNMVVGNFTQRDRAASPSGLYAASGGRKYLNLNERRRALAALGEFDQREVLFVQTLAWSGARVSEVLALTPASFQIEAGLISIVTLKRRRFCVREVPIPPDLIAALDAEYDLHSVQRDPTLSLRRLWPWHRATAWRIVKDVMRAGGVVGCAACPRGFLHGFGVSALQAGAPLNLVQRWLGHSRISTTAIYADACGPEEREFAGRFWKLQ